MGGDSGEEEELFGKNSGDMKAQPFCVPGRVARLGASGERSET